MSYPLGKPINRTLQPVLREIVGRPGWWRDTNGNARYIEPPKKPVIPWASLD